MAEKELSPEEKKIEEVQVKLNEVEEKLALEIRALEQKFAEQRIPLLKERSEKIKAIPSFWKKAMEKHDMIASYLTEEDFEILSNLEDLEVEELYDVVDGYRITLRFSKDNEFFTNTTLSKSFKYNKEKEGYDVEATKVEWKEGKNLAEHNKKTEEEVEKGADDDDKELSYHWFGQWESLGLDDGNDEIAEYIREDIWEDPLKIFTLVLDDDDEDHTKE